MFKQHNTILLTLACSQFYQLKYYPLLHSTIQYLPTISMQFTQTILFPINGVMCEGMNYQYNIVSSGISGLRI